MPPLYADTIDRWVTPAFPSVRGGDGEVARCVENLGWAVKRLHREPAPEYRVKVNYLVGLGGRIGRDRLAFPVSGLRLTPDGPTVGCLTEWVDGVSLPDPLSPRWRACNGATLSPAERVRVAAWYAENLALLHAHRLRKSDGNLANDLVTLSRDGEMTGLVGIDLDGYAVVGVRGPTGAVIDIPATVGVADYSSPEHL